MPAAPASTSKHLIIRQATLGDFGGLLEFYKAHATDNLPAPTAKTVGDTIDQGRILIVEDRSGPQIVASGAVFELSPASALTYVGELAGMRATGAVGGLQPFTMQFLLLGLRLLGHVATEPKALKKDATNSILAIVKETNIPSIRNIEATGMKPLLRQPAWIRYDEVIWVGSMVGAQWKYYFADIGTIVEVLRQLSAAGLFENEIKLSRTEKTTRQVEDFVFHLELADIARAESDLRNIQQHKTGVDLVPPPDDICFETRSGKALRVHAGGGTTRTRSSAP